MRKGRAGPFGLESRKTAPNATRVALKGVEGGGNVRVSKGPEALATV